MPPSRKCKSKPIARQSSSNKRPGRPKKTQEVNQENTENDESPVALSANDNDDITDSNQETPNATPPKKSPAKRGRPQKRVKKATRRQVITDERLLNVIDQISTTVGDFSDKRLKRNDADTSQSCESSAEETERAVYSCKFCKKDFSSAFILCLHIRIHEKVGSISEPNDQTSSTQNSANKKIEQIKEEIEEVTLSPEDVNIKEEIPDSAEDENEPKKEFVGIINKNFVENLRKNLSLAMNRQIN